MKGAKGILPGLLLVAILASAAVAVFIGYSSTPRFCASCHIMETRYISWKNSDHAGVTSCLSCHSDPGVLGEIKAHLAGSRYLYAYLKGEVSGPILLAEVPNENCFKCHEQERLREEAGPTDIHATYHAIHMDKGLACVECHGGLAHATMVPVKARSAMSLCQRCHKAEAGTLVACARCHPSGPSGPPFLKAVLRK